MFLPTAIEIRNPLKVFKTYYIAQIGFTVLVLRNDQFYRLTTLSPVKSPEEDNKNLQQHHAMHAATQLPELYFKRNHATDAANAITRPIPPINACEEFHQLRVSAKEWLGVRVGSVVTLVLRFTAPPFLNLGSLNGDYEVDHDCGM